MLYMIIKKNMILFLIYNLSSFNISVKWLSFTKNTAQILIFFCSFLVCNITLNNTDDTNRMFLFSFVYFYCGRGGGGG